ncbi:elongator complex protein 4-like isoform X2 [Ostrea edulis]|uniref:elongator complex protein 4-like isoform X2 n=1 Tax=Ostrea edulis TaxID=37623 RepID=UPI0024AF91BF|nr:elongator complex protein 4-like isoform X2 [Ostrea edulis]
MAATSFQRKARVKPNQIVGTKPSLFNNQLLISSGVPSLDNIIGGGLAVGTVCLVEEDVYGSYARLLLKYFSAEAAMTGHSLLLTSADQDPAQIMKELPAPIMDDPGDVTHSSLPEQSEKLKIAWRYQHLSASQTAHSSTKFGHYYDLTKVMEPQLISRINPALIGSEDLEKGCTECQDLNPKYKYLLKRIKEEIDHGHFSTTEQTDKRNILRIGVHSLGSPQWDECGGLAINREDIDYSLPRFLLALRVLMRSAFAVCIVTMPTHLFEIPGFVGRLRKMCDTVLHLESFAGSDKEKNPAFKEYHGLFNIVQLPRLNSLLCHMPDTLDFAFKLRRKKFTIEKLHLPPELSETASRNQEDPVPQVKASSALCSGGKSNKLDF